MNLNDIIEHAREDADYLPEAFPIETCFIAEGGVDKSRQIDRSQKTAAVRRQGLLTAGVCRADVFTEPVIVHLVDAIDQDKAGLGIVVRRCHDEIP